MSSIEATRAVVTVGGGRGFVVESARVLEGAPVPLVDRLVITAAHCLPHFPPCMSFSGTEERTYAGLLGRLGDEQQAVWAECFFADPIADIAVLGAPDNQELSQECEAYEALTESALPLTITDAPRKCEASLLSLDGRWFKCIAQHNGRGGLWLTAAAERIIGGMSGSPIISNDGQAIAVVCGGISSSGPPEERDTEGGPQARLTASLPGWLLAEIIRQTRRNR